MIRFPRRGLETASVLEIKRGGKFGKRVKARQMCNWIECDVCFSEDPVPAGSGSEKGSSEGSDISMDSTKAEGRVMGQTCSKCRLVKYCSLEHQKKDWEEHRRVCVKMS